MTRTLQRVGGLLFGAVLLASAAPAQTFHNLYYKGDSTNELTSVRVPVTDGYVATANFPEGAALLKLAPNGDLQWARHYGSPTLSLRTVKLHAGNPTLAWVGNENGANGTIPVVVITDFNGSVKAASRVELGMNAEAKALDFDDANFWVGGTGWPGGGRADPWIAVINHTTGTAQWVRSFHFDRPCQLNSLVVANNGGAVGVGQVLIDVQGTPKPRMFAFKVDGSGNLKWAFRYDAQKVDPLASQHWLADITNLGNSLQVAGVITDLCTDPQSPSCVPRPRSILTATLDEMTGSLLNAWAIYDQNGRPLWAYTIAGPESSIAIGGQVDSSPSDSEALLLSGAFGQQPSPLQGKLYGDGAGPFTSQVEDVAWGGGGGFVFVTQQRHNLFRPAIVQTDANLSAGQACESSIPLQTASVSTTTASLTWTRKSHKVSPFRVPVERIEPTQVPCTKLLP